MNPLGVFASRRATLVAALFATVVAARHSAVAQAAVSAYVSNENSDSVWVLDAETGKPVAFIPLPEGPYGVAVDRSGEKVFVSKGRGNSVALIDATTNRVRSTVRLKSPTPTPRPPATPVECDAACSDAPCGYPCGGVGDYPNGRCSSYGGNCYCQPGGCATLTATPTAYPEGEQPTGLVIDEMSGRVYVATLGALAVVDGEASALLGMIPLSHQRYGPRGVALDAARRKLYVAGDEGVDIVDVDSNEVTGSIPMTAPATAVALSPDGNRLFVSGPQGHVVALDPGGTSMPVALPTGEGPLGLALSPDGTRLYVANVSEGTVSVLDALAGTLLTSVRVGLGPFGIAVTPDGGRVFVANLEDATVSMIDADAMAVVDTIRVGERPQAFGNFIGPAVTPRFSPTPTATPRQQNALAWVVNYVSREVTLIDTASDTLVATVSTSGQSPEGIAVSRTGVAYLADFNDDDLEVIDPRVPGVVDTIPVPPNPRGVAVTPDGATVVVAHSLFFPGKVSIVDVATRQVRKTIEVGDEPWAVAVSPDGSTAYVTLQTGGAIAVIDVATGCVMREIRHLILPRGIALSPDGRLAYVTHNGPLGLDVIELASGEVLGNAPTGDGYYGAVAVRPDGGEIYAAGYPSSLLVVDAATYAIVDQVALDASTSGLAISPDAFVYASLGGNLVAVVDTAGRKVVAEVPAGRFPIAVAVGPAADATAPPLPSPTPTRPRAECPGDCDGSGGVTVEEVVRGVDLRLGRQTCDCPQIDVDADDSVESAEIDAAIEAALLGCSAGRT